jgi:DNA (cytosine-5)-methyltransferase 1
MKPLNLLSLFAGIGGFELGLERSSAFKTVAQCEIDPFCRRVLAKHWPDVPRYEDVRTLTAARLAADGIAIDAICGGFPCQDISVAGRGLGLAGERSGLFYEVARLVGELAPRFVVLENVGALLCRGLDAVLGALASLGYNAIWHCIPASHVGLPHICDRVWIVAYPREERAQGVIEQAFSRLYGVSWRENVGRAARWARRPDLSASGLCRAGDGVPYRVDRTAALGNAVVPQIPELIGRAIAKALEADSEKAAA